MIALRNTSQRDLTHDLVLPTLLFAALGGMTWAIRGCSGFGGSDGCIFAGVMWGAAWWYIARDAGPDQSRRYCSAWIILAVTFGFGFSGARGWMQWSNFFDGRMYTNYGEGKFVPISRAYGFLWLFIAGMPWAGIAACMLAWCGSRRPGQTMNWIWVWVLRLACGFGAAFLARYLFREFPEHILPLYSSMESAYKDITTNPNLRRVTNDCRNAVVHMGFYLGFLTFEVGRRDWKNALLILTVGVLNGAGWALCQNWKWAPDVWPDDSFNWWRCWESSGGISIGIAYGVAYFLVNRRSPDGTETVPEQLRPVNRHPNLERYGAYLGLIYGLGYSIQNGMKGWANIYLGNEDYWEAKFWIVIGPTLLLCAAGFAVYVWKRSLPAGYQGDVFPHAYKLIWLVLIVQNIIALAVTGPFSHWNETIFSIYYFLLFLISATIVCHYHFIKTHSAPPKDQPVVSPPNAI